MNISSIVVQTSVEHLQKVIDYINALDSCEVYFNDAEGKIIATIEGESISEQMDRMMVIQRIPFVFSANLAYSYCEDELTNVLGQIKDTGDPVPEQLKEI